MTDYGLVQYTHPAEVAYQLEALGLGINPANPPLGTPLKGAALREALRVQRTGHVTSEVPGRLWNAPPPVDPRTGMNFPAAVLSCPAPEQDGTRANPGVGAIPAGLATGGIINIKAGTKEGGEFNRRVAIAGGRVYYLRGGLYNNLSVTTEKVNSEDSPIIFSWLTGIPAGRSDDLWDAPYYADDGGGGKKFIPEGATQFYVATATTMRFGIFADGTERTWTTPTLTVGQSYPVPASATHFATGAAVAVYFLLAPL